ncbi:hypothetical protein WJX79_000775 [Trebouxia sp. C0005]
MAVLRHLWHVLEADLPAGVAGQLDAQAAMHWNTFYQQNKTKFFKDRHYLEREFPELGAGNCTILEVGCGVGNTAFPLLELNRQSRVYACDFAPSAVEMVKANPQYSSQRMHAFVADITCDDLSAEVPVSSVDMCTMVFVLSAITPAKMPAAVANVARVLKAGRGRVLVRDYAEGDLAQLRLSGPTRNQRLSHNFYVRSDGTQAYYFSKESLMKLFLDAGFTCQDYKVHERQIENRRQQQLPETNNRQHPDGPDGTATQRQRQTTDVGEEPSANLPPLYQGAKQHGTAAAQLPPDTVQRQEWEEGGTTPQEGPITGSLFAEDGLEEVVEDVEIGEEGLIARVVSVSRQHRHTLEHTGLMRWESCLPLARFLLAVPSLTQGKQVLELGCGVNPLCCLAALRHSRKYIATDGSLQALQGLARNLDLNCRTVVMERARTCILAWGNAQQEAILAGQFSSFDTIVGADVVYAPEAIASLFATCNALLSPSKHARLILCHIVRRISEDSIIAAAAAAGMIAAQRTAEIHQAMKSAVAGGPFRILVFYKRS